MSIPSRILVAWLIGVGLAAATGTGTGAQADHLNISVQNLTADDLSYVSGQNIDSYPPTIASGATGKIQTPGGSGSVGGIVYKNQSCFAEFLYSFIYNKDSGHCDDKNFTFRTSGNCTYTDNGCGGSNDCDCHLVLSPNN